MTDAAPAAASGATPIDRVHSVFARVRAADLSVADLYNDDAELTAAGRTLCGRKAIRDYYAEKFVARPHPHVVATLTGGSMVAAVLDVQMPDGRRASAVDVFELDDTGIVSMTVYTTGP